MIVKKWGENIERGKRRNLKFIGDDGLLEDSSDKNWNKIVKKLNDVPKQYHATPEEIAVAIEKATVEYRKFLRANIGRDIDEKCF